MTELNHRNKLIVKSNTLIESKYHLSVREQKFLIYLASLARKDDIEYKYTSVRIKDIESALKTSGDTKWGSVYEVIREVVLSINKKPITIRKPNGGWTIINWFSTVDADPSDGIVTFELSDAIKSQLVMLNEYFTKYRFGNVLALKSGYSIRIYELLKLNQFKHKITYELDYFRELIGVSYKNEKGEMIHKYSEYKAFKRSIIKHAQNELKRETDIYFELKEHRENRKVKSLTFYVFKNTPINKKKTQRELFTEVIVESDSIDNYEYNTSIVESFVEIGLLENKAKQLYREGFNKIDDDNIRKKIVLDGRSLDEYFIEKIDYVKFQMKKTEVKNPPGLLVKAIKENYSSKEAARKKRVKKQVAEQKEQGKKKKIEEDRLEGIQKKLFQKEEIIINELVNSKETFLEELFKNDYPELWIGYNKKLTLKENFLKSKMVKYKIMGRIKEQHAAAFLHLEKERKAIDLEKKRIERL